MASIESRRELAIQLRLAVTNDLLTVAAAAQLLKNSKNYSD